MASRGSSPGAAAGRCAQAECIASRDELELLKRDLDELEGENNQLHDELEQKVTECRALARREADAQRDAERLGGQLTLQDGEIARLRAAAQELNATVVRFQQDARDAMSAAAPAAMAVAAAGAPDAVVVALREQNDALEATVTELRAAIARETSAGAYAHQQAARIEQHVSKDKRDALVSALQENELLRREAQARDEALEKVSQLALDYEIALKVLHDQQRDYLEALDELRIDNAQQRTRIEQLEREKENVEAKLIEMDEHERHVDGIAKALTMRHDMEKAVLRAELDELREKAVEWTKQQRQKKNDATRPASARPSGPSGEADLEELERQLELVHELRVRDQLELEQKELEIQQLRSDVESLVEHLHEGGSESQRAVRHAVETESRKHTAVGQDNAALKRRLKEQGELVEQLELRQAQLEKDLVEAQDWNAKYEAGAGLEDVIKFQKKLRRELEKQQLANQRLRQELNDQREATGKMHIAFERLKAEAGKPVEFEYDDVAIENHLKGELAVHQAVMAQLEHQLHELEEERVRLLQKLREQARVVGGKLYEAHGLTMDQWHQVEEFIERVKLTPEVARRVLVGVDVPIGGGGGARGPDAHAQEREDEVRRLQKENARLREELADAAARAVVGESRPREPSPRPRAENEAATRDTKSAATSPVKLPATQHSSGETNAVAGHGGAANAGSCRSDSEQTERKSTAEQARGAASVQDEGEFTTHQSRRYDTRSAEDLAQAIAAALESRLLRLHESSTSGSTSGSTNTHSVATQQPSPATRGGAMDHSLLAFETERALSQQIDFLREFQLLLDECAKLETQNESLQEQLAQQETACKSVMDQQSVVYQHFFHLQDASTTEKAKLLFDMQQLKAQHQEMQRQCQRYEATLHSVEQAASTAADEANALRLRGELVELTRRVAHDEVAFATLKREHVVLQEEHRLCVADAHGLESDWLEMERVLKFRILYLESWKSGAEDLLARMEATLDKCVLKSVADRGHEELEALLAKHARLGEEHAALRAKYLTTYELPLQLSRLHHENALLVVERAARQGDAFVSVDAVAQSRITQLQGELDTQVQRVKELEEKLQTHVAAATPASNDTAAAERVALLESENAILCERIGELEQLYEGLEREHGKAKQDAELAASQAHTLSRKITQEKARIADTQDRLRELMAATEDHAVVARLQQQLVHMKTNYQHFLLKYDHAVADQQHAAMQQQQLALQMEAQAKSDGDARETARAQLLVLEAAIQQVKARDHATRNAKWETFKKRLDGLEDEMRVEQDRRRALEKELEEKQAELPFGGGGGNATAASVSVTTAAEIHRLRGRIDALETRERVLMGQLDVLATHAAGRTDDDDDDRAARLAREVAELKRVHGEMLRQLQAFQARNAELLQLTNELETQKRGVQRERDDLEIEFQQLHAQLQLHGGHGHGHGSSSNQYLDGSPSSPIMHKKVGLYEKDHVEQQQAAQASIASLKQLLTEKNAAIAEYQKKITSIRADVAAAKAQDRADASQLHKKLYEENQRTIVQLKDAADKIHHLERTGSDRKARQAAQDRHAFVLEEWKRVELELAAAHARLRERDTELLALRDERDVAEARAGEALEEIVLHHERLAKLEKDKKAVEDQLACTKRDAAKREDKMQLLREAVVRLKEEFLKAEDRHAVEVARARHAVTSTRQSKNEREQWREEKEQLEAQGQMLQEKLALAKKSEERATAALGKLAKQQQQQGKRSGAVATAGAGDTAETPRSAAALAAEVERLKGALKDKVVGEARIVDELERKIKVLQAQNLALRESAPSSSSPATATAAAAAAAAGAETAMASDAKANTQQQMREQWEAEKRLQRRVDVVTMRLKEKQAALETSERETARLAQRLADAELQLRELQRMASSARDAIQGGRGDDATVPSSTSEQLPGGGGGGRARSSRLHVADADELERQNAFLQETLVLKRKEWEQAFATQMESYEAQLLRLRARLAQRHDGEGRSDDATRMTRLEREERAFVAEHDVRDELRALGEELRAKERAIVAKDTRLMELELELESLRVEYQRLHRKASAVAPATLAATARQPSSGAGASRRLKSSAQERLELEEVVENMKKVIEKLRSENEKLRKAAAAGVGPDKLDALRKKLKEARDARLELQTEVEQLRSENGELTKDKLRLQQRVRQLTSSAAPSPASKAETARRAAAQEDAERLHELQRAEKETQLAELRDRVAQKDAYIRELSQQLAQSETAEPAHRGEEDGALENKASELQRHVDALALENAQLRMELSAFDQDFFEEIEDLKYKYAQAVRDKQTLERRLREH